MNEKWFFIGTTVGIIVGLTFGKIMFDKKSNLPIVNKWEVTDKINELEEENKLLREELNILIEHNIKLISDSTDSLK